MNEYARVIIDQHHQRVDRMYTYRLTPAQAQVAAVGMMVKVPFGNRLGARGYVVDLLDEEAALRELPEGITLKQLKTVDSFLSDKSIFTQKDLALAREMQRRYMAPLSACLSLFVPKPEYITEKEVDRVTRSGKDAGTLRLGKGQKQFLDVLEQWGGSALLGEVRKVAPLTAESLRSLEKSGLVTVTKEPEECPAASAAGGRTLPLPLKEEQRKAYEAITGAMDREEYEGFLLHGITGSGKTEVYMQCIQHCLDRGRQAILLVPEISLTPQLIDVFCRRFEDRVGVTHSRMTDKERAILWHRAGKGQYRVIIGPRSALFTPFRNLGLVILDEEHETSYRSEQLAPHYRAGEVAELRCRQFSCPLVLGSATPGVETYFRTEEGRAIAGEEKTDNGASPLKLLTMSTRAVPGAELPAAEVVDMREEIARGNMSIFCTELAEKIRDRLEKKEQVILFLNRKGYSTTVSCRGCGFVLKCPRCNLPYTYHKDKNRLICHHCGKDVGLPETCPRCGSRYLKQFGIGTQKVEELTKALFPQARVMRMDMSTMKGSEDYEHVYRAFREGEGDILVGTQMVAKGFDFPGVTLVGVLAADQTLFDADFHGVERTFQLLTQVSGRAGRGRKEGEAVIQTYAPEHYCITAARQQDYGLFYRQEIASRRMLECPPFTHIAQVVISGPREDAVRQEIRSLADFMKKLAEGRNIEVLGPSPAALAKINNIYRWKILVKCREEDRLRNYILYCTDKWSGANRGHELLTMDIDPSAIL
ncbi:MAG: primosomal protein N' [Lachnospiraceae bacterium]|nr:primosomal protein N' [Lachnospiraceae bacterium]